MTRTDKKTGEKKVIATRQMLQPSKFDVIEDYEHAQDSVGEWFSEIGLDRGERRKAAYREAVAKGETPPPKRIHSKTRDWRRKKDLELTKRERAVLRPARPPSKTKRWRQRPSLKSPRRWLRARSTLLRKTLRVRWLRSKDASRTRCFCGHSDMRNVHPKVHLALQRRSAADGARCSRRRAKKRLGGFDIVGSRHIGAASARDHSGSPPHGAVTHVLNLRARLQKLRDAESWRVVRNRRSELRHMSRDFLHRLGCSWPETSYFALRGKSGCDGYGRHCPRALANRLPSVKRP